MRILLVRLRLIGDVVFTTPLVRALKREFPQARLTYVVEPAAEPVMHDNPHVDELIVAPRGRGLARLRDDIGLARRLRREAFDVALDLHGGPRSAWLTWASGARRRIGYTIRGRSWMYTDVVQRADDLAPRHSVENQWDLLAPLGIGAPDRSRDDVEMRESAAARTRVERRLRAAGIGADHRVIVVHVSAGNEFRRWPERSFVALVTALADRDRRRRVLLTSGPSDRAAAARIADAARASVAFPDTIPMVDEWDLAELHALATRADVFIGGDSGPAHIAATTRTPIVEILGPTIPERSEPWRDPRLFAETVDAGPLPCRPCRQRHCEPGDFRCLTTIPADRVVAAAERAMASGVRVAHDAPGVPA